MDFFITGLPRSRTAWLANFLTTGKSYCAHDAILGCASLDAFAKRLAALPGEIRGDSDSGLAFFAPALMTHFPEARWAVVRREPRAVIASLLAMEAHPGMERPTLWHARAVVEAVERRLFEIERHPQVRVYDFETLDTMTALYSLWEWCLGDRVPWCPERAAMLQAMRVNIIPSRIFVDRSATEQLVRAEHLVPEVA